MLSTTVLTLLATSLLTTATTAQQTPVNGSVNDIDTLNYALTLEQLESAFYTQFQAKFTSADFVSAGYTALDYQYLGVIASHEQQHVQLLNNTIAELGGTPVSAGQYNFTGVVTSVPTYLAVARVLENTGVDAYDGAISSLTDYGLQQAAASIATVEARHAAYLNLLNSQSPFPNITDDAMPPVTIAGEIMPFVVAFGTPALVLPVWRNQTSNYANETASDYNHDLVTLNYALTLEHLESTLYNTFLPKYNQSLFTAAGYPNNSYAYLQDIRRIENAHASLLNATITAMNGTGVPLCTYNFSAVTDVKSFLALAAKFETTATSAYDGAVNTLTSPILQEVAATIATVEGRQSAYLNTLNNMVPFPNVTDAAYNGTTVSQAIAPYLKSCPYNIMWPYERAKTVNGTLNGMLATNFSVGQDVVQGTNGPIIVLIPGDISVPSGTAGASGQIGSTVTQLPVTDPALTTTMPATTIAPTTVLQTIPPTTTLAPTTTVAPTTTAAPVVVTAAPTTTAVPVTPTSTVIQIPPVRQTPPTDAPTTTAVPTTIVATTMAPTTVLQTTAPTTMAATTAAPGVTQMATNASTTVVATSAVAPVVVSTNAATAAHTMAPLPVGTGNIAPLITLPPGAPDGSGSKVTAAPATVVVVGTAAPSAVATSAPTTVKTTASSAPAGTSAPGSGATSAATSAPQASAATAAATAAPPSTTVTTSSQLPAGLAVCNVIDPTRFESPWHGSNSAFPQVYDTATYVCVDNNFLCPSTAPLRCAYGCYTSSQYYCQNSMLYQVGAAGSSAVPTVQVASPTTRSTSAPSTVASTTKAAATTAPTTTSTVTATKAATTTAATTAAVPTKTAVAPTQASNTTSSPTNGTYSLQLSGAESVSAVSQGQTILATLTAVNNGTLPFTNLQFTSYFAPVNNVYAIAQQQNSTVPSLAAGATTAIQRSFETNSLQPGDYVIYFVETSAVLSGPSYIYLPFNVATAALSVTINPATQPPVVVVVNTFAPSNNTIMPANITTTAPTTTV